MPLCIRSGLIAKTVADHTLKRSFTTKPIAIRPPPLHAMNGVTCSGSSFAEKARTVIRQAVHGGMEAFDRFFMFAGQARFAPWPGGPQAERNAVQRA